MEKNEILLTFRPRREPASRGMADLLLSVMRPIRWSPSLDGCHVTGCYSDKRHSSESRRCEVLNSRGGDDMQISSSERL